MSKFFDAIGLSFFLVAVIAYYVRGDTYTAIGLVIFGLAFNQAGTVADSIEHPWPDEKSKQ